MITMSYRSQVSNLSPMSAVGQPNATSPNGINSSHNHQMVRSVHTDGFASNEAVPQHPRPQSGSPTSHASNGEKEVDYYLNPTELFRWINYRRWDGATARVLSNPEECKTWIVSRHSGDGRILWRHLPLHLICMQSDSRSSKEGAEKTPEELSVQQHRLEELIDCMLDTFPEGASKPDDQGMLPLHLCIANSSAGVPNERILAMLLLAYPRAVQCKDQYGRTPPDILREKNAGGAKYEAAIRAMRRAHRATEIISKSAKTQSVQDVNQIRSEAEKERRANQSVILRLEEELAEIRRQTDDVTNINKEEHSVRMDLEDQTKALKSRLEKNADDIRCLKEERDTIKEINASLQTQLDEHDDIVAQLQIDFEKEQESQVDEIASLRSEVNTSRAMTNAMEEQLRSRFANEEYLSNSVDQLEMQTSKIKAEFEKERKQVQHEKETLETESSELKKEVDEMTTKNGLAQNRIQELKRQLVSVVNNHSTLNAEQDRMMNLTLRNENELIETVKIERDSMLNAMRKQREILDKALSDAENIAQQSREREAEVCEAHAEERRTGLEIIEKLKKEFSDARSVAMDHRLHADSLSGKVRNGVRAVGSSTSCRPRSGSVRSSQSYTTGRDFSRSSFANGPSANGYSDDDTSTVTSNATKRKASVRKTLTIDTEDNLAPENNLLRILDNRAEHMSVNTHGSSRASQSRSSQNRSHSRARSKDSETERSMDGPTRTASTQQVKISHGSRREGSDGSGYTSTESHISLDNYTQKSMGTKNHLVRISDQRNGYMPNYVIKEERDDYSANAR